MKRKTEKTEKKDPVSQEAIDRCLANAVAGGDFVNFRFLFFPYSPLRDDSTEDITSGKYAYLRAADEDCALFQEALRKVAEPGIRDFVRGQLEKSGPAQLPAALVMMLGDNAVRLGKYAAAAQAYELLRIRDKMREQFFEQADTALDQSDAPQAARGYLIAAGLAYDYAAFPEPLPAVPNYQTKALMLHAEYPRRPEDCVALMTPDEHLKTAIEYLLLLPEAAARLERRPASQQRAFIEAFVRLRDPDWDAFAGRYKEACAMVEAFGERFRRAAEREDVPSESLADVIEEQEDHDDYTEIPAHLLGRAIKDGEWWQYLKDLAYEHPAAALFISRQAVSKDLEIIMPRLRADSPLAAGLGLV